MWDAEVGRGRAIKAAGDSGGAMGKAEEGRGEEGG